MVEIFLIFVCSEDCNLNFVVTFGLEKSNLI